MMEQDDEKLYLDYCQTGNPQGFQKIYERYADGLYRFIFRFTLNQETAEDILQEVFQMILDQKFRYHTESNLKAWLFTSAKNKSLNYLRNNRNTRLMAPEEFNVFSNQEDLETSTLNKDLQSKLEEIHKTLPPELALLWSLRKEAQNLQQISLSLGVPVGTVKSRFHRLVEYIRKELNL